MRAAKAKLCLLVVLLALLSLPSHGANPRAAAPASTPDVTTIRKRVEEVQIVFTVEDGDRPVKGVTSDQVKLLEDGEPIRALTSFRQQSDLPLRAALLIDRSDSMQKGFAAEQQAAREFLGRVLRPQIDSAFLGDFSNRLAISQPVGLTSISTQLDSLHVSGLTALYDALYEACHYSLMNQQEPVPVRRVIILLSDGEDNYSRRGLDDAIEAAQRADIVIYAITAHADRYEHRGDIVLRSLAEATGGRAFILKSYKSADRVFAQIEDELRTQYSLTFRPRAADRCGYHNVQLLHANQKLHIRSRDGYYGCRP